MLPLYTLSPLTTITPCATNMSPHLVSTTISYVYPSSLKSGCFCTVGSSSISGSGMLAGGSTDCKRVEWFHTKCLLKKTSSFSSLERFENE